MNAFYGVLGSSGCRFFDPRLASSITMRGHEIMHRTRELIEARGYAVIYGDTDSTFVWLRHAHDEEDAARIGRELVSGINAWWRGHLRERFGLERMLDEDVNLVSLVHVPTQSGLVNPAEDVGRVTRAAGVPLLLALTRMGIRHCLLATRLVHLRHQALNLKKPPRDPIPGTPGKRSAPG